jgi:D-glycero-D-manno-heptose 1,7-bisphosphate phosphatase
MGRNLVTDLTDIDFVFLDRDGVLNQKARPGEYITSCEELIVLPGVADAIAALNRSGRKVIVVTNQRGVALGLYSLEELGLIHEKLTRELAAQGAHLDAIYYCPHDKGQCDCRKPGIGMFERAFRDFPEAKPGRSIIVGDSLRDIEAGVRAGMKTVFVTDGAHQSGDDLRAVQLAAGTVTSLPELVAGLLSTTQHGTFPPRE